MCTIVLQILTHILTSQYNFTGGYNIRSLFKQFEIHDFELYPS